MMNLHLKCLLKALTGYDCPFCGAQRAFVAFIHGDISGAWHYNPYLFIISPYLLMILMTCIGIIPEESRLRKMLYNRWSILSAGIMSVSWWVLRNII